jgi:hypothetical protein
MSQGSDRPEASDGPEREADASTESSGTTRRRLLASGAATWATVAVAGCSSDDGENTTTDDEPGPEPTTAPDTETTEEETPTPEPQPENFVVTTETWTGGGVPAPISFMSSCARSDTFVPGMQMVFFVGVFDPDTGDRLTDEDLDGAQINLGDGMETIELEWTDEYEYTTRNEGNSWVGSWDIPEDAEPQSLSYTVEVSTDANVQNVGVLSDAVEIVEYDDPSNLVVDTDTFWNGTPPEAANGFVGGCAPTENFGPDMDVTFTAGIYDSTSGNMVGSDGLYNGNTAETVEDQTSEFTNGIDSVTVVSPDGSFDDVSLSWSADPEAENPNPQWSGTLDTAGIDPGTYAYEVQITDESSGRFDTGIASAQFSIIEVPEE